MIRGLFGGDLKSLSGHSRVTDRLQVVERLRARCDRLTHLLTRYPWTMSINTRCQGVTVALMAAAMHSRNYQHLVFDTPARPNSEDLAALVEGCELLAIPTTPDILSIEATLETVAILEDLGCHHYKILLTIVPPGRKTGQQTREALEGYPMFSRQIRRYAAYEKAALEGVLVKDVKDRNAGIAWSDYERLGKELMP